LAALPPVSDNVPEKAGEVGDIVTLIAPTTVPDAAPPHDRLLWLRNFEIAVGTALRKWKSRS
jgi:hypothetical protein